MSEIGVQPSTLCSNLTNYAANKEIQSGISTQNINKTVRQAYTKMYIAE